MIREVGDVIERVQADGIRAIHKLHALDADRSLAGCQAVCAAVFMIRQALRVSGNPGDGREPCGRCSVERRRDIQVDCHIVRAGHCDGLLAQDLGRRRDAVCGRRRTIRRRAGGCLSDHDGGAFQESVRVRCAHENAGDAGLRDSRVTLVIIGSAALQDAGVLQMPVSQLPHIQCPDGVGVVPQAFVAVRTEAECSIGRDIDHRLLTGSGAQLAVGIVAAREGRPPGHWPLTSVRSHVATVWMEAAVVDGRPGLESIVAFVPLSDPERGTEGIYRRVSSSDVKIIVHAFHGQDVHGPIRQAERVGPNVPSHWIFVCPILDGCGCLCAELRGLLAGQIVHRRHGVIAGDLRAVILQGVLLRAPRVIQHCEPTRQTIVFGVLARRAERPPGVEDARSVCAVQDRGELRINQC